MSQQLATRATRGPEAVPDTSAPLALVYRSTVSPPGCAESLAEMLRHSGHGFRVRFVGPREQTKFTPEALSGAAVFAYPGGDSVRRAWRKVKRMKSVVRDFVDGGGSYLGVCLGAYLAAESPGFGLIPGDCDQYLRAPGASILDDAPHIDPISWHGAELPMYVQDAPYFFLNDAPTTDVEVLARYQSGHIAAMTSTFGAGRVSVCGPHPEAGPDWFLDDGLPDYSSASRPLARELVDSLLTSPARTAIPRHTPNRFHR